MNIHFHGLHVLLTNDASKTNKLMTSLDPLFTTRLYTIKTKEQRNWSTTFYTNNTTHTSPNLQRHTVPQLNSTHFSSRINIRDLSFKGGGGEGGWYNVFSQMNFFLPYPNFLQKKKTVTLPLVWPKKVMSLPTLKDMTRIINKQDEL